MVAFFMLCWQVARVALFLFFLSFYIGCVFHSPCVLVSSSLLCVLLFCVVRLQVAVVAGRFSTGVLLRLGPQLNGMCCYAWISVLCSLYGVAVGFSSACTFYGGSVCFMCFSFVVGLDGW